MKRIAIMFIVLLGFLVACDMAQSDRGLNNFSARVLSNLILDADRYVVAAVADPVNFTTLFGFDPEQSQQADLALNAVDCINETVPSLDNDNDGIPANFSYTVDCTVTNDNNGSSLSLTGGSTVRDNDDTDPRSGYVIDVDEFRLTAINAQQQSSYILLDLDVNVDKQTAGYTVSYNFKLASKSINDPEQSISHTYSANYTPDNSALPFAAGTFNFVGDLTFQSTTSRYTLSSFTDDLHYRDTCALGFDRGNRRYMDSEGNELSFTYNDCGDVDITFNGFRLSSHTLDDNGDSRLADLLRKEAAR